MREKFAARQRGDQRPNRRGNDLARQRVRSALNLDVQDARIGNGSMRFQR
jgi:hypothetical protein